MLPTLLNSWNFVDEYNDYLKDFVKVPVIGWNSSNAIVISWKLFICYVSKSENANNNVQAAGTSLEKWLKAYKCEVQIAVLP